MKTPIFDQEWFTAQFGKRPIRSLFDISNEIKDTKGRLVYLEKELFDWEIYHAKEDAALKCYVNTIYNLKNKKLLK